MTVCFETIIAGYTIKLIQHQNNNFTVVYGQQIKGGLSYTRAADELGCAIMHASACEGLLTHED